MKKKLLILFAVIAAAIGAEAETFVYQGITYNVVETISRKQDCVEVVAGEEKYSGDITIPSSFTYSGVTSRVVGIGKKAFSYCTDLTSVSLPSSVTYIGESAFKGCTSLGAIVIPDAVTELASDTFFGCSKLASVKLSDNLTTIGGNAFYNCGIESITIPASVTTISTNNPFAPCHNLKEIIVAGGDNFYVKNNCLVSKAGVVVTGINAESIAIPAGATTVGCVAFGYLNKLKSITIPSSVTEIMTQGVSNSNLTEVICLNPEPPTAKSGAFHSIKAATCVLKVPVGSKEKYETATLWRTSFTNIEEVDFSKFEQGGLVYTVVSEEDATCKVTKSTADLPSGDLVIPATVVGYGKTYTVVAIATSALTGNNRITSLTLPNTMTEIEDWAVTSCGIKWVKFSDNLQRIGSYSFNSSVFLETVEIPASVTKIGFCPFNNCTALTEVTVAGGDNFYVKNNCLISKDGMLMFGYGATLARLMVPDGVKIIDSGAFELLSQLESVTFPSSVEEVRSAFPKYSKVKEITCLRTVPPTAGNVAFNGVDQSVCVLKVPVGSKAAYEAANLWKDFQNIEEIVVDFEADGFKYHITSYDNLTCEVMAKEGGYSGNIVIPTAAECEDGNTYTVTAIQSNAFPLNNVTSVELPQTVTKIGDRAFALCMNMTRIDLPAGLTTIEEGAFGYCTSLTEIVVPDGVTEIPGLAFVGCSGLKDVTLGNNVESIGDNAFAFCSALESLTVGSAVPPTLGTDALKDVPTETCTLIVPNRFLAAYKAADGWKEFLNLQGFGPADEFEFDGIKYKVISHDDRTCEIVKNTEKYAGDIIIPETVNNGDVNYTVTGIAFEAFRSCQELTSIELPNTLKTIGGANFMTCDALTSIVIPDSVETIGSTVLYRCKALKSVTVGESVKSIGSRFLYSSANVEEVISLNPEPPTFSDTDYNSFDGVSKETCILQVPRGSKAKYAAADKWQDFLHIEGIGGIIGDINGDGVVDDADVVVLVGCIVGECALDDIDADAADVNGDGVCDVRDVVAIIAIIVGE